MAYNDFTLEGVCSAFGLSMVEEGDLFSDVGEAEVSPRLLETLEEYVPLATAIHTEKARSEFIVAPILAEVRRRTGHQISLFSGIAFDVDREKGLNGTCDFLLARSPVQLFLQSPVMAVVGAKIGNIKSGLGQCIAEMVAARIFNERAGRDIPNVFGAVTTGTIWRFLMLSEAVISVDLREYFLGHLRKIVGILLHRVEFED
jgi:hypothetical protein